MYRRKNEETQPLPFMPAVTDPIWKILPQSIIVEMIEWLADYRGDQGRRL